MLDEPLPEYEQDEVDELEQDLYRALRVGRLYDIVPYSRAS